MPIVTPAVLIAALVALAASTPAQTPSLEDAQERLAARDLPGAELVLRELTEAAPDDAWAWLYLGATLHAQREHEAAFEAFETAAAFVPTRRTASYNAACAKARLGEVDAAFEWLGKAVAAGHSSRRVVDADEDLAALAGDPRLDRLLPPVREGAEAFVERPRVIATWEGEAPGDQFGWVTREVGDLDGDGVSDFASTAPTHAGGAPGTGRVYVYSSRTGETLFTLDGEPGWQLGTSVAGRVDVDGDGTPDVIVGAPHPGVGPGHVRVVSGADGSLIHEFTGGAVDDRFGQKVSGIEDLDGDGHAEVVVGEMRADGNGIDSGAVSVFSGRTGERLFRLVGEAPGDQFGSAVDATVAGGHRLLAVGASSAGGRGRAFVFACDADVASRRFTIETDETGANLGQYFVTLLGDVDDDGVPDVYASDWNNAARGPGTGRVFVHSGATGERLLTITGHVAGEGFGTSAALCGDADGDGRADLVIGAWQNAEGGPAAGKCYLHSGADGALLATWTSLQPGDTLGFDAIGVGDVDGDGEHDFVLSSAWSALDGPQQGRVFLVAGEGLGAGGDREAAPAPSADDG